MKYSELVENEDLSKHSYYRIGGVAKYFYLAEKISDLQEILKLAKQESLPIFILGSGSNVLFSDEGYDGLVVENACKQIKIEGNLVKAESGVALRDLVKKTHEAGLGGMENLWGLPGTIGGAVRGNAGSFGTETKDLVKEVKILDPDNLEEVILAKGEMEFEYRSSKIKREGGIVLEVTLALNKKAELLDLDLILEKRKDRQPPGLSCGSFFKNPPGEKGAGQLIDEAGLKGLKVGGAQISEKHANFLLNIDHASFADMIELKNKIQETVLVKFGIELEAEVAIVTSNQ